MSNKRRPILMGQVEQVATGTEAPCPDLMTQRLLESCSTRPADPNELVTICAQCGAGVARLLLAVEVPS